MPISSLQTLIDLLKYPVQPQNVQHGLRFWFDQIPVDIELVKKCLNLRTPLGKLSQEPDAQADCLKRLLQFATGKAAEEKWVLSIQQDTLELFIWGNLNANEEDEHMLEELDDFINSATWWTKRYNDIQYGDSLENNNQATPWENSGLIMFKP